MTPREKEVFVDLLTRVRKQLQGNAVARRNGKK
jgi:hypothetical protein